MQFISEDWKAKSTIYSLNDDRVDDEEINDNGQQGFLLCYGCQVNMNQDIDKTTFVFPPFTNRIFTQEELHEKVQEYLLEE